MAAESSRGFVKGERDKSVKRSHWYDTCHHDRPLDRFLGTVKVANKLYDVWVYQDNALSAKVPDMHVCIRYSSKDSKYISPGNAQEFVERAAKYSDAVYLAALPLVQAYLTEGSK